MLLTILPLAAAACLLYGIGLVIYRIYFHPLSRFPGPKLAAASLLYEGYYDLIKDGQVTWHLQELHEQYGPVIRINPREIHVRDPDYVETLYSQRWLDKDPWFSQTFGIPLSGFGTWNSDLHRQRRGAINKFFSKASIASRANVIEDKVLKLCNILESKVGTSEVVQIDAGFTGLTVDVISEFCFGVSWDYLDVPGFPIEFRTMMENTFASGAINRQLPIILKVMSRLPVWLVMKLNPQVSGILRLQELIRVHAKRIVAADKSTPTAETIEEGNNTAAYYDTEKAGISKKATIFDQILSSRLSREEKEVERLVQEGQSLIAAGSETTSRVLALSMVHLHENPAVLARLRKELETVMPTPTSRPSLAALEKLPYLTAIIKESIRLGGSTATRTSRLSPSAQPLRYKEHIFPPGTPVSVTLFDVLMDSNIFPDPLSFKPERWFEEGLDKYFVAFSRGPRSCVGLWLAWAESYLAIAHVYRRFEFELFETEVEDVAAAHDRFSCFAKKGSKGVRVKVVGVRK